MGITTTSYAQWSAGALVGLGHLYQRESPAQPSGTEPVQPLKMAGVYGQFITKNKWAFLVGSQLRYQRYTQGHGVYDHLVLAPYLGISIAKKVEIAVGPELTALLHVGQSKPPTYRSYPAEFITGYNVKATYWLGHFGLEGGYSNQKTAFTREYYPYPNDPSINYFNFYFYNSYVYGALKYRITR